jgi:hypothetical protein
MNHHRGPLSGSVVLNALLNWMLANDIDPAGSKR